MCGGLRAVSPSASCTWTSLGSLTRTVQFPELSESKTRFAKFALRFSVLSLSCSAYSLTCIAASRIWARVPCIPWASKYTLWPHWVISTAGCFLSPVSGSCPQGLWSLGSGRRMRVGNLSGFWDLMGWIDRMFWFFMWVGSLFPKFWRWVCGWCWWLHRGKWWVVGSGRVCVWVAWIFIFTLGSFELVWGWYFLLSNYYLLAN
jgi:hypothetical protein